MRSKVTAPLLALLGVVLLGGSVALAHGASSTTGFSGYEVFAGLPCSIGVQSATCGTSFTGWTHDPAAPPSWQRPPGNGGKWAASVNYTGTPGPGRTVSIVGGVWEWRQPNGTLHRGRVLVGGTVVWPTAVQDIGCGVGVAKVKADISLGGSSVDAGDILGCLNDALGVVPPRIWGNLALTTPH